MPTASATSRANVAIDSDASLIPLFVVFILAIAASLSAGYLIGVRHRSESVTPTVVAHSAPMASFEFTAFGKRLTEPGMRPTLASAHMPTDPTY
jgi:hypothetical protein